MNQLYKSSIVIIVLTAISILSCKKKEVIVYVNSSNIKVFNHTATELSAIGEFSPTNHNIPDSIFKRQIDLDLDGIMDISGTLEFYHADTSVLLKSYVKRLHQDVELLNVMSDRNDSVTLLTKYTDEKSYVTPNPDLWRADFLYKEIILNDYEIVRCYINGDWYNCYGQKKNGFFSLSSLKSTYFVGFRLRDKNSTYYDAHWYYGYMQLFAPGSGSAILLEKTAIEYNRDQPILMKGI